jgi:hypothetical protein
VYAGFAVVDVPFGIKITDAVPAPETNVPLLMKLPPNLKTLPFISSLPPLLIVIVAPAPPDTVQLAKDVIVWPL